MFGRHGPDSATYVLVELFAVPSKGRTFHVFLSLHSKLLSLSDLVLNLPERRHTCSSRRCWPLFIFLFQRMGEGAGVTGELEVLDGSVRLIGSIIG